MSCKKLHDATALSGTVKLAMQNDRSLEEHISLCQDCRLFYEEELVLDQMIMNATPPLPEQLPVLKKPVRRWVHPAWGIAAMIFVAAFLTWNITRNPNLTSIIAEQEETRQEESTQSSSPATPETQKETMTFDKGKSEAEPETLQETAPRLQKNRETAKNQTSPAKLVSEGTDEEKTAVTSDFINSTPPPAPKTRSRKISGPSGKPGTTSFSGNSRLKKSKAEPVAEIPLENHLSPDEEAGPVTEQPKELTLKSKRSQKTQTSRKSDEAAKYRIVQNAMEIKDSTETQADETSHDIIQIHKEEREHLIVNIRVHSEGEAHAPDMKYFILAPAPTQRVIATITGFISGNHPELKLNQDVIFGLDFPESPGPITLNLIRTGHPEQPLDFYAVEY
jgi:hypothetical protein